MGKPLVRLLPIALLGLSGGYFAFHLWDNFHHLPQITWGATTLLSLAVSVVGSMVTVALIALMWVLLLRDQNVHIPYKKALEIVSISQMGKYLPGNIGHFTGRALLGKRAGIPMGKTVATMAVETFWTLAISASLTLAALFFYVDGLKLGVLDDAHPGYLTALCIALLFAPYIGVKIFNWALPSLSRKLGHGTPLNPPQAATAAMVSMLMMACFGVLGAVLQLQTLVVFGHSEGEWLQLTLLYTVAWTAGYLVPGSPGGLGVREAMMINLLTPIIGIKLALGTSISMRATSMLGDGLSFLSGLLMRKISSSKQLNEVLERQSHEN
jgi:glycosyltransferase 2 family protein